MLGVYMYIIVHPVPLPIHDKHMYMYIGACVYYAAPDACTYMYTLYVEHVHVRSRLELKGKFTGPMASKVWCLDSWCLAP
jgi:hypothetical protein